jgi:hypothetical protein
MSYIERDSKNNKMPNFLETTPGATEASKKGVVFFILKKINNKNILVN